MSDLAKLVVRLEAETAKYQKELERANGKLQKWERQTKKSVGNIKTLIGGIAFGVVAQKVIQATVKQEAALAQLEARLKSTGGVVGFTKKELADFASELQNVSTFGDEDLIGAMSQLATFTQITGEEFKEATIAAANLSTAMGTDLKSSVLQIGKAMNAPITGISALAESGIQFTEDQKELVKAFVDTGQVASAQRVILKELETQFGGSAKAARNTFGGALKGLENAFGDLLEGDSGLNQAAESLEDFTSLLSDPKVKAGANALASAIVSSFAGALSIVTTVGNAVRFMAEEFASFVHGPAFGDTVRINERIEELQGKINTLANSRSITSKQQVKLYEAEIKKLQDMLDLEQSLRVETNTGGSIDIEPQGEEGEAPALKQFRFVTDPKKLQNFETLMNEYGVVAENAALYIEDSFVNAFNNIASNISTTLASAIVQGESLGDAFANVGKMLLTDMLAGLIKVGAQMALNALFAETTQATLAAANIATGQAVAAAWAPAAAFTSLASFGANAAPAQVGIATTVGLSNSLAIAGIAHDGIDNIPREGTWLLDGGERVLSPDQNRDLTAFLEGQAGGEAPNISIHMEDDSFFSSNALRRLWERMNEEVGDKLNVRVITV